MISLCVVNNVAYVWKADDWYELRKLRIVGNLRGSLANFPHQDTHIGLPAALLPEETTLLLEKGLCTLRNFRRSFITKCEASESAYANYLEKVQQEQVHILKEVRKRRIKETIDIIAEGKRAKLTGSSLKKKHQRKLKKNQRLEIDSTKTSVQQEMLLENNQKTETTLEVQLSEGNKGCDVLMEENKVDSSLDNESIVLDVDKGALLQQEIDKIPDVGQTYLAVQIFTGDPWVSETDSDSVTWHYPKTEMEILRYQTFKDLWERGYHITSGAKFGANYLAYPGDPLKFHAHLIVVCMDGKATIKPKDIISYGRLGQSVRKTVVLSYLNNNEIRYQSIQWQDAVS